MADRRYKLINRGLPGVVSFSLSSLADGDVLTWNLATRKWDSALAQSLIVIDPTTIDLTADYDWTGSHTFSSNVCFDNLAGVQSKDTGGTCRNIGYVDGSDTAQLGSAAIPTHISGGLGDIDVDDDIGITADDISITADTTLDLTATAGDATIATTTTDIVLDSADEVKVEAVGVVRMSGSRLEYYANDNATLRMDIDSGTMNLHEDLYVKDGNQVRLYNGNDKQVSTLLSDRLELGCVGRDVDLNAYIDFHTNGSGTSSYDGRIICLTGTGHASSNGQGTMYYYGGEHKFIRNGSTRITLTDNLVFTGNYTHINPTNAPGLFIDSSSNTSTVDIVHFRNASGSNRCYIETSGSIFNSTGIYTSSDVNKKRNIVPETDGIVQLRKVNPINFQYKTHIEDTGERRTGFSAQELRAIVPEAVVWKEEKSYESDKGTDVREEGYVINSAMLMPMLANAIKDVDAENDRLRRRIKSLEDRMDALEGT